MERRHAVSTQASEKACVGYDTSQLEDEDMYSSSEDEEENDEDGLEKALVRATPTPASPRIAALPESTAPLGFLASFSSYCRRSTSPLGTDVFGIANKRYFHPSRSRTITFQKSVARILTDELGPYSDLNLRRIVVEREAVPEILISGLITPQEARDLFDM